MAILPFSGAIYVIQNMVSGGVYVGQTTKNVARRRTEHLSALQGGRHHNQYLQYAWNKHGSQAFEFCVLELLNTFEEMNEAELFYIQYFRSIGVQLYNLQEGGMNGRKSIESIEKRRVKMFGKTHSEEARAKIRAAAIGRKPSIEAIEKRRLTMKGREHTPEWNAAISKAFRGRKWSSDAIKRRVESRKAGSGYQQNVGKKHTKTPHQIEAHRVAMLRRYNRIYTIIDPSGVVYETNNLSMFCNEHNLNNGAMYQLPKTGKKHKGWSVRISDMDSS